MILPVRLHLMASKIEDSKAYMNKYTYSAHKYNYPHMRILTSGDLVKNKLKADVDLPEYVMNFVGEKGEVLVISNIINKEVPYVQLRDLRTKEFSVYGSQTKVFFGQGMLPKDFKYGDPLILVEGSMDHAMCYGFYKGVLATFTAGLTSMQFEIIKMLTNKVILAYDNDKAGRDAKVRDSKKLKEAGFDVKYLNHFQDFKDMGDLAEAMFLQDEMKVQQATTYYNLQINSLVRLLGGSKFV